MPEHKVGTQEEFDAALEELRAEEKEHTRRSDELATKRQELPWVKIEKDYSFETEGGTKSLPELFDGRSQLMIYHFMFGPSYELGCPVCSSIADTLDPNVVFLNARDVKLMCNSRAPLEKLLPFRERMGWSFDWASNEWDFHRDLGFASTEDELKPFLESGDIPGAVTQNAEGCGTTVAGYVAESPGLSVYALSDGDVYRTYVSTARGLEQPAMSYYGLLDRAPMGRNEDDGRPFWVLRHDEY